jgi:adenylyltransferase/sulfurtransferase
MNDGQAPLKIALDGRFARLERIEWWDQSRLSRARVLVVGAGALGNEVIKNLALLGVGHLVVADMDRVELSNLSRSVLFRGADEGRLKAECAVAAARAIYPEIHAQAIQGNVLVDLGLGFLRWADVVVGALDNREARLWVNRSCAMLDKPWIDGGIEVLSGIVRGFAPPRTSCYECTMNQTDWDIVNQRRSCSLLARRALAHGGTPTTPTTASVIGAMQVQEVVKILHGREGLMGSGFVFDGGSFDSYQVRFPVNPDCPWHAEPAEVHEAGDLTSGSLLGDVWRRAEQILGGLDAIELGRELVDGVTCEACGTTQRVLVAAESAAEADIRCSGCGAERAASFVHSVFSGGDLLVASLSELRFPPWDVVWARHGSRYVGIEITGDRPADLMASERDTQGRQKTCVAGP